MSLFLIDNWKYIYFSVTFLIIKLIIFFLQIIIFFLQIIIFFLQIIIFFLQNKEEVKSEIIISNKEINLDDLNGVLYGACIIGENYIIKKIKRKDIIQNIINYLINWIYIKLNKLIIRKLKEKMKIIRNQIICIVINILISLK